MSKFKPDFSEAENINEGSSDFEREKSLVAQWYKENVIKGKGEENDRDTGDDKGRDD